MKDNSIKYTFIKYVSLNILGMLGLSCYILADTFFVARGIGADGLTALNLAIPIYSFIHGTGLMIGMGGATRFAITKPKQVFTQSLYFALFIAILFVIIGALMPKQLAAMLGANSTTLSDTTTYLRVILCFAPLFILNNVIICFVRNDGSPHLSMFAMLIGSFSNIVLDYIFIFPCEMGIFGAALATGIAPLISLFILSVHFIKRRNSFKVIKQAPKIKALADISSIGISALITELSSGIVIIVFNIIILKLLGNLGVAAYGIIANIALVIMAVFTGVSQGIQPIISPYYREKNMVAVKQVLRYGVITIISISVVVYLLFFICAPQIVGAFNKDSSTVLAEIATNGLRIYFTAFCFVGINILCATYFSATANPRNAFVISMLRGFILIIPSAFILSSIFGINGVWITMTVTELIVLFVSIYMMRRIGVIKSNNLHVDR